MFRTMIAVIFFAMASQAQAVVFYGGHAYDLVFQTLTWPQAKTAATLLTPPVGYSAGHLLTISDASELAFLASTIFPHIEDVPLIDGAWAGMTDEVTEGEWHWIDSSPGIWQDPTYFPLPVQTAFTNWAGGEPNNSDGPHNENYLSIRPNSKFNDYFNTGSNRAYLVEFESNSVPEPSTMISCLAGASLLCIRGVWRKLSPWKNSGQQT